VQDTSNSSEAQDAVTPTPAPVAPAPVPAPAGEIKSVSGDAGATADLKRARRQQAATPSPARPASGSELARAERVTLAFAIETGNAELPMTIARLIQFAPESFDDLRLGKIAKCVRAMREQNQAVHFVAVAEKSGESLFISAELAGSVLRLDLAEREAQTVLAAYQVRKAQSVFDDAANSLRSSPAQAKTIITGVMRGLNELAVNETSLSERIADRLYRADVKIPRPESRYAINGVSICTPENLTTISGQAKSGKTSLISAMIAATFAGPEADCLGCGSSNPNGLAVIHIDTEQTPFDHQVLVELTVRRAGRPLPPWVKSYCLTGWTADEIRKSIPLLLETNKKEFGGIHSCFLDGGADCLHDVNDPGESNGMVAEHHAQAIEFDCPLIINIHENPGGQAGKMRGHYGSQCERKAETNLKVEKEDEICTVYAEKNRHAPITKKHGPRFAWDGERGMHVSVESRADAKEDLELEQLTNLFQRAFSTRPAMSFSDLTATVKSAVTVSESTAIRKIKEAVTLGIIKKTFAGLYEYKR
jgi:hypothetical protein